MRGQEKGMTDEEKSDGGEQGEGEVVGWLKKERQQIDMYRSIRAYLAALSAGGRATSDLALRLARLRRVGDDGKASTTDPYLADTQAEERHRIHFPWSLSRREAPGAALDRIHDLPSAHTTEPPDEYAQAGQFSARPSGLSLQALRLSPPRKIWRMPTERARAAAEPTAISRILMIC